MIRRVRIATELLKQIEAEARAAFPRECCGLLVGERHGDTGQIFLAHPASNIVEADDRFESDPQAQFALSRALRGTEREIIGCYHSHPNGRAEPSPRDVTGAGEVGFVWVVAAVDKQACRIEAFVFDGLSFQPVEISEPLAA